MFFPLILRGNTRVALFSYMKLLSFTCVSLWLISIACGHRLNCSTTISCCCHPLCSLLWSGSWCGFTINSAGLLASRPVRHFAETSQQSLDWLAWNLVQELMFPRGFIPLTFPVMPPCGFKLNVSATIRYIALEFGTHIHAPLWTNCNHFANPVNFYIAPPSGQN